jgi:CheY-like chemotaxis protein
MHGFPILYVEDEANDVLFLENAFREALITNPLKVVVDGQQAMDYLAGRGRFSDRQQNPLPGMVLLDLKLPKHSGLEVLKWVREQPQLQGLIVVVYTSSTQPDDIEAAYGLGANGYLVKQSSLDHLGEMVRALRDFWLVHNQPVWRVWR